MRLAGIGGVLAVLAVLTVLADAAGCSASRLPALLLITAMPLPPSAPRLLVDCNQLAVDIDNEIMIVYNFIRDKYRCAGAEQGSGCRGAGL